MSSTDEITLKDLEANVVMYIFDLCAEHKIPPDHGFEHAVYVASLARLGLSDFPELSLKQHVLVQIAALLHDMDDPKVFLTSVGKYPNATACMTSVGILDEDQASVIQMIKLVSYSKNRNSVDPELPKWMYIPRDADRIAGGGYCGVKRTLEFNERDLKLGGCPFFVPGDLKMLNEYPVSDAAVRDLIQPTAATSKGSLFQFYITDWANRGVCASGSAKLQKIFKSEYHVLNSWITRLLNAYQSGVTITYALAMQSIL